MFGEPSSRSSAIVWSAGSATGSARAATFRLEKNSGLKPTDAETGRNPRARSARLRYGIRTEEMVHA